MTSGKITGMTMLRTASRQSTRKSKKSYSLSSESVAFLESLRRKRHAASISSVLEDIVQSVRRADERRSMERSIAEYYDSFSPADREEESLWGEFALRQFRREES